MSSSVAEAVRVKARDHAEVSNQSAAPTADDWNNFVKFIEEVEIWFKRMRVAHKRVAIARSEFGRVRKSALDNLLKADQALERAKHIESPAGRVRLYDRAS